MRHEDITDNIIEAQIVLLPGNMKPTTDDEDVDVTLVGVAVFNDYRGGESWFLLQNYHVHFNK